MGFGLALMLVAIGVGSLVWAVVHMTSIAVVSARGGASTEFALLKGQSTEPVALDDETARLRAELERVTDERDRALQALMELEDRWSW